MGKSKKKDFPDNISEIVADLTGSYQISITNLGKLLSHVDLWALRQEIEVESSGSEFGETDDGDVIEYEIFDVVGKQFAVAKLSGCRFEIRYEQEATYYPDDDGDYEFTCDDDIESKWLRVFFDNKPVSLYKDLGSGQKIIYDPLFLGYQHEELFSFTNGTQFGVIDYSDIAELVEHCAE